MYKISVIVPIYNAQNHIKKCIDSLICQWNENMEILLINDGSEDSSENIIKEYMKKYPNKLTYYKKENTGVADTRNFGIDHSKGNYLLFVDSDDFVEVNYIDRAFRVVRFFDFAVRNPVYFAVRAQRVQAVSVRAYSQGA